MIFDKPIYNRAYDTWCPGNSFTDFIVADWVLHKQPGYLQKNNILTFYTPIAELHRDGLLRSTDAARKLRTTSCRIFRNSLPEFVRRSRSKCTCIAAGIRMFLPTPGSIHKSNSRGKSAARPHFFRQYGFGGAGLRYVFRSRGGTRVARSEWIGKANGRATRASGSEKLAACQDHSDPCRILQRHNKKGNGGEARCLLNKSSPPEKDLRSIETDSRSLIACLLRCKLCTPEKIESPALMVCGIHQTRRNSGYSLRCIWRASRSNRTGPTCVAA